MAKHCCLCGHKFRLFEYAYSCHHEEGEIGNSVPIVKEIPEEEGFFCTDCARTLNVVMKNPGHVYEDYYLPIEDCIAALEYVESRLPLVENQIMRERLAGYTTKFENDIKVMKNKVAQLKKAYDDEWANLLKNNPSIKDNEITILRKYFPRYYWYSADDDNIYIAEKFNEGEDFKEPVLCFKNIDCHEVTWVEEFPYNPTFDQEGNLIRAEIIIKIPKKDILYFKKESYPISRIILKYRNSDGKITEWEDFSGHALDIFKKFIPDKEFDVVDLGVDKEGAAAANNAAQTAQVSAPAPQPAAQPDALSQIKQLKELLDMEAITQEEFDQKKKQLLNL